MLATSQNKQTFLYAEQTDAYKGNAPSSQALIPSETPWSRTATGQAVAVPPSEQSKV